MAKKERPPPSVPSKAYLVSFGDTMTALLAFFIVMNSLASEQTGAKMYSGTGSFVSAVKADGYAGSAPTAESRYVTDKVAQTPLYALAENLDKNEERPEGKKGPDEEGDNERKIDRDKEQFQQFLTEIERQLGLKTETPLANQVVFDSFEYFKRDEKQLLSDHAIQLCAEVFPILRDESKTIEVIVWATMPSPIIIKKMLKQSESIKSEIESKFWIRQADKVRIRYTVKPWLFTDAKRPIISFVVGQKSAE